MIKIIYQLLLYPFILPVAFGQLPSKNIIIDQFGYLPGSKKIAIIKNPVVGFDKEETFIPGTNYELIDKKTSQPVYSATPVAWKSGSVDESSGDKVWQFDFSEVTVTGTYYVLDVDNNRRSFEFQISPGVYNEVLKQAVRSFFYQRAGFKKEAQYAGDGWADGASHIGPLQDKDCRLFSDKNNAATSRDLSGGWYDAGDYNKYTSWTANYVVEMMKAYLERPEAWADNYNLPESGNGIPDLLDEATWGINNLLRLQEEDGSVLSIVGESHASPPSAATGQSLYGPANTSATLNTAGALAISSKVFRSIGMNDFADTLQIHAEKAWIWADANPDVLFNNNDPAYNSVGLGAGQMEVDDFGRLMAKLEAACFLFDITQDAKYRGFFDTNYQQAHLIAWNYAYPFETATQEVLLYYTTVMGATPQVVDDIKQKYQNAMENGSENFPAYNSMKDPYMAHLANYTWGSNGIKSAKGSMFYDLISYGFDNSLSEDAHNAALNYIHYIHGANPLNMVYLSNMYKFGGDNCVNEFYHSWFTNNSQLWDRVGVSAYGPPPGYLTGGANPSYDWDGCCPDGCGSSGNNEVCLSESISPPKNQPPQKSYKDFNTSWPLNSWSVTENSCGYQVKYIRLLSKFVDTTYDCHGDLNGTATIDACGNCAGGNTGVEPVSDTDQCQNGPLHSFWHVTACSKYESPGGNYTWYSSGAYTDTVITPAGLREIITIDLKITQPSRDTTLDITACDSYTAPGGTDTWTSSGNYQYIIPNQAGCDSLININLHLNTSFDSTITVKACRSYTTPDGGNTWNQSGTYIENLTNTKGCDSIITYNLTINNLNTNVTLSQGVLTANDTDLNYQWLNCDNNFAAIEGAVEQSFSPTHSGNFAVKVMQDDCTDTSLCIPVTVTGIVYNNMAGCPVFYPNPVVNQLTIILPEVYPFINIEYTDLTGRVIYSQVVKNSKSITLPFLLPEGLYLVKVSNNYGESTVARIVKNNYLK